MGHRWRCSVEMGANLRDLEVLVGPDRIPQHNGSFGQLLHQELCLESPLCGLVTIVILGWEV